MKPGGQWQGQAGQGKGQGEGAVGEGWVAAAVRRL